MKQKKQLADPFRLGNCREHPASEVYVTGTFDGWKKTEQLEKVGEHFEKHVQLSDASKKIYYKVCAHLFSLLAARASSAVFALYYALSLLGFHGISE